ncbi:MAG TPA: hypothetical protein VID24_07255 [Candidatus Eremiobacteraceae bacterium]|jgi:hypothetical protein
MSPQQIQTVVIIGVLVLLVGFRIYRQTREQRWPLGSMWVMPIIFILIVIIAVAGDTISGSPLAPLAAIVGLAIGFGVGMYQGNHTTLRIDKPGKAVFVKVKPIGTAIFIGVLALRIGIRWVIGGAPGQAAVGANGLPVITPAEAIIGSGLLAVAVGSIIGLRWYVKRAYDEAPTVAAPTTT